MVACAPADAAGVGATVIAIALAHDARVLKAQFQRGQARLLAERLARRSDRPIHPRKCRSRILRGSAPVKKLAAARDMIAAAVAEGIGVVVHQTGKHSVCSRNGYSGLRMGVNAKFVPGAAGVQFAMTMPLGTYTKPRRNGGCRLPIWPTPGPAPSHPGAADQ